LTYLVFISIKMTFDSSDYIIVMLNDFVKNYSYPNEIKYDKIAIKKNCKTVSWGTELHVTYIY
jgi:hypothetical protein